MLALQNPSQLGAPFGVEQATSAVFPEDQGPLQPALLTQEKNKPWWYPGLTEAGALLPRDMFYKGY